MQKTATVNRYYYQENITGLPTVELEFIDHSTGAVFWKRYQNPSKKKVLAIAAAAETRFFKKCNAALRFHGSGDALQQ